MTKKAPVLLRKGPATGLPSVDPERLQQLLSAPALGEAHAVDQAEEAPQPKKGRQRGSTRRRRADRAPGDELDRLQLRLPQDISTALRHMAVDERRSISDIIESELRGLLKRRGRL